MYRDYFGFHDDPFRMTPDTRYLFDSSRHQEAISALLYGISERKGFIVISGEIGTGKTTLVRALLNQLSAKIKTAVILNPRLSEAELLHAILDDLGVEIGETNPTQKFLLDKLNAFLLDASARGENVAVIIDEAQNLDAEVLEAIRLLSNLETEQEKLIQIILVGQPELNEILRLPRLEQLRSRIAVRYHITPLEAEEVPAYIRHRLRIAGNERGAVFTDAAMKRLAAYTRGVPRLINVISDKCLLAAFVLEKREIDEGIVSQAIKDHEGPAPRVPQAGAASLLPHGAAGWSVEDAARRGWQPFLWGAGAAAAILIGFMIMRELPATQAAPATTADSAGAPRTAARASSSPSPHPSPAPDPRGFDLLEEPRTAAFRALLLAWKPEIETEILSAADPEALAKGLGLTPVRVTANIRTLEAIDLPVVLPVARPEGTTYVTLLAVEGQTYEIFEPRYGKRRIPRTPERLDPRSYPGALLLLPEDPLVGGKLAPGTGGPRVARLQECLRAAGETVTDPEGEFGPTTRAAVRNFQERTGLAEDGVVGVFTIPALLSRASAQVPRLAR